MYQKELENVGRKGSILIMGETYQITPPGSNRVSLSEGALVPCGGVVLTNKAFEASHKRNPLIPNHMEPRNTWNYWGLRMLATMVLPTEEQEAARRAVRMRSPAWLDTGDGGTPPSDPTPTTAAAIPSPASVG